MATAKNNPQKEGMWLKVFCPNARCLTEEEMVDIPPLKRKQAGDKGLWLEVFCPDEACLRDEEKIMVTADACALPEGQSPSLWLNVFCPDDQCLVDEASKIP